MQPSTHRVAVQIQDKVSGNQPQGNFNGGRTPLKIPSLWIFSMRSWQQLRDHVQGAGAGGVGWSSPRPSAQTPSWPSPLRQAPRVAEQLHPSTASALPKSACRRDGGRGSSLGHCSTMPTSEGRGAPASRFVSPAPESLKNNQQPQIFQIARQRKGQLETGLQRTFPRTRRRARGFGEERVCLSSLHPSPAPPDSLQQPLNQREAGREM